MLFFLCLLLGVLLLAAICVGNTFESNGRLMQLENAELASRRGASVLALASNNSAVLLSWSPEAASGKGSTKTSLQKFRALSSNIGMTGTGVASDIEFMANYGFDFVAQHSYAYSSPAPLSRVARSMASEMHLRTVRRGWRPFGVRLCLVGYESGAARVIELDPMGNLLNCNFSCIGANADKLARKLSASFSNASSEALSDVASLVRLGAQTIVDTMNDTGDETEGPLPDRKMWSLEEVLDQVDAAIVGKDHAFSFMKGSDVSKRSSQLGPSRSSSRRSKTINSEDLLLL